MRRRLYVFLLLSALLMAIVPLHNLIIRGIGPTFMSVFSRGSLSGLRETLFNLDAYSAKWTRLLHQWGISTNPLQVIIGRDGWLYLGDKYANTLTATREGLTAADQTQAERVSLSLIEWKKWLNRQGVKTFKIMIGPNKDSIYPQGLPVWAAPRRPAKIDALVAGSARDLIVDLREGLVQQAASSAEPLYYKTDTHWNALGAAHAVRLLSLNLKASEPSIRWCTENGIDIMRVDQRNGGDLAQFLRMEGQLLDREPVLRLPLAEELHGTVTNYETWAVISSGKNTIVDRAKDTVLVQTPGALNQRKVLWVRDSFGAAMSPYMAATFSQVMQLHYDRAFEAKEQRLARIVQEWHPDLVIVTVVERAARSAIFLALPPS